MGTEIREDEVRAKQKTPDRRAAAERQLPANYQLDGSLAVPTWDFSPEISGTPTMLTIKATCGYGSGAEIAILNPGYTIAPWG